MKRTIDILRKGAPIARLADGGTPLETFALLRMLGLPDPVEVIKRESKMIDFGKNAECDAVAEYSPDWHSLAESFGRLYDNLKDALDTRSGLLVLKIDETPGVFADCPVKDGMDALAVQAVVDEDLTGMLVDKTGAYNLRIRSVVRGVQQTPEGVYVPCVYALYEGSGTPHLAVIGKYVELCDAVIRGGACAEHSIRTTRHRSQKQF
jgi:hypothetical protein